MSILRRSVLAVGAVLTASVYAFAGGNDVSSLKSELADLKAKVAAMESAEMAPGGTGDAESLTSMKKKGAIRIGGDIKVDVIRLSRDDATRVEGASLIDDDDIESTRFSTGEPYGAYLNFKINAGPDTFLYIKLDLDDSWDSTVNQDDLIEELYFRWNHVRGSNWDIVFGKKSVDYGMDKYLGITPSFHDGWAWWMIGTEETDSAGNIHSTVGTNWLPAGGPRNLFQIEAIYTYKDLAKFYLTLFQDNTTTGMGRLTRGMHEDRSDDTLFFESFGAKAELTPVEGLLLQASVINHHTDSMGDSALRMTGVDATEDQTAISLGFDYTFKRWPVNIWGEWQHGFDWTYDNDVNTDTIGLGLIWGVTEAIDLGIMGEWASIDDATLPVVVSGVTTAVGMDDEDYWQIALNFTYKFPNGIYLMAEYAHVWYDGDPRVGSDADSDADMLGFRTGWNF